MYDIKIYRNVIKDSIRKKIDFRKSDQSRGVPVPPLEEAIDLNLYLTCEAINAGTCAIAAYDQEAMDELIQVDGKEQFVVYLAPVGKY